MGNGKKFYGKRTHRSGQMSVQTGVRGGELQFRFPVPDAGPVSLTRQQAWDLAECLDEALDDQDKNPIILPMKL